MNEVSGDLEKPHNSDIEISDAGDAVTVRIPRPRMPFGIYAAIVITTVILLGAFIAGLMILVLQHNFPGYTLLMGGPIRNIPLVWRLFGITAWVSLLITGVIPLYFAIKPLTRRENILFAASRIVLSESIFVRGTRQNFAYRDVGEFRDRRDPRGLLESELVMLLNRPMLAEGGDEVEIAQSTSEAEKEWLAPVLNAILSRFRED